MTKTLASVFNHYQFPEISILEKLKARDNTAVDDIFNRMDKAQSLEQEREILDSERRLRFLSRRNFDLFLQSFSSIFLLGLSDIPPQSLRERKTDTNKLNDRMRHHCFIGDSMRDAIIGYMRDHDLTAEALALTSQERDSLRKIEMIAPKDGAFLVHFTLPDFQDSVRPTAP